LVQLLWDLGLEIGHSIRTVDECMSESAPTSRCRPACSKRGWSTARRRVRRAAARYARRWTPQAFFHAKTAEMRLRHAKYEDTPYSLEPNVKESPGALRDLQVILWVAKAAGLAIPGRQLAIRGLITRRPKRAS
jgi:[protein-PII] uridylyltransferase